jgi:hypothetical protein
MEKKIFYFISDPEDSECRLAIRDEDGTIILLVFSERELAEQWRDKKSPNDVIQELPFEKSMEMMMTGWGFVILNPTEESTAEDAMRICQLYERRRGKKCKCG